MLVSPRRNQRSSWMIERTCIFFVVRRGKQSRRSNRSCAPKTEKVPVLVRSNFHFPFLRTKRRSRWYCSIQLLPRPSLIKKEKRNIGKSRCNPIGACSTFLWRPASQSHRQTICSTISRQSTITRRYPLSRAKKVRRVHN